MRISKDLKKFGIYSLAGLFSLALHAFVVFLLLVGWTEKNTVHKPKRPNFVQATLVQMAPRAKAQDKQAANKKAKAAAKKRAEKQRKEKAHKKKAAQRKKAERKKAEQKKARDEKIRRDKAWKKKQAEETARKVVAQKKAEQERQAQEAERQEELQRQARAQALASALDNEDEFLADEENVQLAQSYTTYIQQRIIANWTRPLSARRNMEVILVVKLVPTGQVVGVSVLKSSGDDAFDLSALQAVKKVGRFDKLQQLSQQSPAAFEENFRQFQLVYRPDDLRL
ncbi:MAG: cell envelope integrity protein TolA [Candidatus Reddybacter sp.]